MTRAAGVRAAPLLLLLLLAAVAWAGEPTALPVRKTVILASGATYFIEGRQVIGPGVEITIQKGTVLEGRGSNAVLEVQGALKIRGVTDQECTIRDLVIEPAATFDEIRIDTVEWKSGALRTAPEVVACGTLSVENTVVDRGVPFDVCFGGGEVRLLNTSIYDHVKITGGIPKGKERNTVAVNMIGCHAKMGGYSGFLTGLSVTGASDVVLRNTRVAGPDCIFENCGGLTFDGNKIEVNKLIFRQAQAGRLKGWKLQKCDFSGGRILFEAPLGKAPDRILVDKCWFSGLTRPKEVLERVFGAREGVEIHFGKISERPLGLAG